MVPEPSALGAELLRVQRHLHRNRLPGYASWCPTRDHAVLGHVHRTDAHTPKVAHVVRSAHKAAAAHIHQRTSHQRTARWADSVHTRMAMVGEANRLVAHKLLGVQRHAYTCKLPHVVDSRLRRRGAGNLRIGQKNPWFRIHPRAIELTLVRGAKAECLATDDDARVP